ncbi:baseplate assembly protein [Sphingomonas parva]|uniref:Baseplate assembly protein n=1 Tax=Sphingomonas parva TaxID=2555898 RepID=A0A4Y8ZNA8_9SPHN|nr:phage baseplate assembly protein V [Sphingomonas parva]TFI56937.1 baseplate assembly protein [Sphingomonas parva]
MTEGRYFGKYRATVSLNVDPERRGRIQMMVPDVLGPTPSSWAENCAPLSGPTGPPMGIHIVPPVGAAVWAEFEQGDLNYPIWSGCRWSSASDLPPDASLGLPVAPNIVLQTLSQHCVIIGDAPPTPATGGIILRSASKAMIVVNDSGIYITNGKGASITLVGPSVTVNNGALVVT